MQELLVFIIIIITIFIGLCLTCSSSNLAFFIVKAQTSNATELLANFTDDNHYWKSFGHANITQVEGNLTLLITTNDTKKIFNYAALKTQINSSTATPAILTFDYASKNLIYPSTKSPQFTIEIRSINHSKILWAAPLNDTSGNLQSAEFLLSRIVLNKPIEFGLYVITQGEPSHSILSLKKIHIHGFTSLNEGPILMDSNIKAEVFFTGLKYPTNMAFLGPNDILVLEKNNGTVQRIINGTMLPKPILDVNVAFQSERGMEGIAVTKNRSVNKTYVFLYFTESKIKEGEKGNKSNDLGNRLYRYELSDNSLVNPKLLLDLPSRPCCVHNGGEIVIGPDNNIYTVIGDTNGHRTIAQNFKNGTVPDGTSAIYRITEDGESLRPSILGDKEPLNKFYAYGIRNSFGMDFDPVTGNLWDTENGPGSGDEINLVIPGFNSGWAKVQGIWNTNPSNPNFLGDIVSHSNDTFVDFGGRGKYSAPEFTWSAGMGRVGVTAVKFFNSTMLGKQYENDMFVGDFHNGYLYHFDLSEKRDGLSLDDPLRDRVADSLTELEKIIFGIGFGGITDIQMGPDEYLYILGYEGTIFRLVPSN